ncbi:MAG: glycosyltransferase family 4 protein [Bacteroidales bacterium]|nr:glycosyltransferase family 4 protein [Bacteroidales bacterium]
MKICFYCNSIYSFGGVQRVLATISSELAKNHQVTILTLDPQERVEEIYKLHKSIRVKHIKYERLPIIEYIPSKLYALLYKTILPKTNFTTRLYGLTSFPKSRRLLLANHIENNKYNIVVGVHVFLSFHLAAITNQISSKTIGWMHNSYEAFFYGKHAYIRNQEKRFKYQMTNLNKIIVLSNSDKHLFQSKLNVPTTRIYNPLTITSSSVADYSSKTFLAVGRLVPQKGFDILIEAFAKFSEHNSEWKLNIIGDGPEKPLLDSIIERDNLSDRVKIHSFTKNIEQFYKESSIYILSSRWEGFGLVLFEAMQYKLPLIVSDIPIVKELLSNKEFAYVFKNEDSSHLASQMAQLSSSQELEKIGDMAYKYSEQFRINNIIKEWDILFKS